MSADFETYRKPRPLLKAPVLLALFVGLLGAFSAASATCTPVISSTWAIGAILQTVIVLALPCVSPVSLQKLQLVTAFLQMFAVLWPLLCAVSVLN